MSYNKPILKWVGGKTQIIDKIMDEFPKEMNNYHELFLGGGSVLIELLNKVNNNEIKINGKIYAYDINETLINMYKNIQNDYDNFYEEVKKIVDEYKSCDDIKGHNKPINKEDALTSRETYYYWIRKEYNSLDDKCSLYASVLFLFLNKTCFRGVYRIGPNGFNVPYGNYKNPEIVKYEHLKYLSELIKEVEFRCSDFCESFKNIKKGDFVYLDPPYAPETKTSFVKYTGEGFDINKHNELFDKCNKLKDVNMLMSNADVDLVKDSFSGDKYVIKSVLCKRSINSKKPDAKTNELLIKNRGN